MLRRPHHDQPDSFDFTPANRAWAEAQITKYPEGRQASAIIPLLWRAQEQEGWLSRPAIEYVADMLGLAHIRALEVASFYFMFQLKPVGSLAHIQVCGTTSCMICGAEDLVRVCREKIADKPHVLSGDGRFSWEEVECLGACSNAPMAQIGKDYYEDLTAERLSEILDELAAGKVPTPGPQTGRFSSEPLKGLTSLKEFESGHYAHNASVDLALAQDDTIKRIDGTETALITPWLDKGGADRPGTAARPEITNGSADRTGVTKQEAKAATPAKPPSKSVPAGQQADAVAEAEPETLDGPRAGATADDLKKISGVGPKLEATLNDLGFWHFDQIAAWGPAEIAWVDSRLRFKGRITRDDWVAQARELADQ
ncbi:NADH-quinone oxidoreductase subunit E [Salibaculum sp.]|uniref:NADH-quinone oxidoreductase subunit E n=1 Tax=Salibaculum sp. TaxID=2855480 RepID=UPI002B46C959|nr:NADH-quinone oxidoreductase subunit E [Salibaculum sp.]HKL68705.1 NADH-quinone oxidoreductase subunit E [Salibaculum sp.]